MIGGIVMNNASGMNCGTHANSDKMLLSARIILADGTLLDTGNDASKQAFSMKHAEFITQIQSLRDQIRTDKELSARIRYKYSIKNVTGLNLLPFITFDDPFDIITHLMVGSEGTLAFLSEVTMSTEYDYPHKASAMLYFKDIKEACRAVVALKKLTNEKKEWIVKGVRRHVFVQKFWRRPEQCSGSVLDYKITHVNYGFFESFPAGIKYAPLTGRMLCT